MGEHSTNYKYFCHAYSNCFRSHLSLPVLLVLLLLLLDPPPVPLAVVDAVVAIHHGSGDVLIADDGVARFRRQSSGTVNI